jgi:CBS domain-containing protein
MLVHEIMTPQPITVRADTTIVEAANTMLLHHIGALPVVDAAGTLIGIISEGDFIRRAEIGTQRKRGRWLTCLVGKDQIAAEFVHEHGRAVGEIMTPDPLTVTEDTPLDQIVQIMEYNNVKRLPVMRGNQLVGIVGHSDFLQAVADLVHDVACPPASDDRIIRSAVITAIEHNVWRPARLRVIVRDGIVRLSGVVRSECIRQAVIVAAKNVTGVKQVHDHLRKAEIYPPPEEDFGGGDFVSLQEHPSTTDDQPL